MPDDASGDCLERRLIEQSPDAVIFADRAGTIQTWNACAQAMFGHAADEAIGRNLDLIIPPHLREAHWRGYRRAMESGRTRLGGKPILTRAVHKDGSKLYLEIAFAVIRGAGDEVLGALATARAAVKPEATASPRADPPT